MADSPTQTFLVQLPSTLARRIASLVDYPDAAYESVSEFLKVAAENQLVLDTSGQSADRESTSGNNGSASSQAGAQAQDRATGAQELPLAPMAASAPPRRAARPAAAPRRPAAAGSALTTSALLALPAGKPEVRPPLPTSGQALTALTNRLSPLIVGPRILANMTAAMVSAPKLDTFTDAAARASRDFGLAMRIEDDLAGRRGRGRRSTAWPVGDDESKSLIRYRNSFMLSGDAKGVGGPLVEFQFVSVDGSEVFLTETGAAMAAERIPALDDYDGTDLLTPQLRQILAQSLVQIPGEVDEIRLFLEAVSEAQGLQDEVDRIINKTHNWSDAQVVSHRAAMIGRLRDLAVIDVEALPKTTIVVGPEYEPFTDLLAASATTNPAEGA